MVSHNAGGLSIPIASRRGSRIPYRDYIGIMGKRPVWQDWGTRFRHACRDKPTPLTTKDVADRLGMAESSVRSWLNGTREINLSDFFRLCDAVGIDPATVLFSGQIDPAFSLVQRAWDRAGREGKALLSIAAETALRLSATNPETRSIQVVPPKRGRGGATE